MPIAEAAARGSAKLARKATQMATSWAAAKPRMVTGFRAFGFGPMRTSAYEAGIAAATYRAPDPSKWASRWSAKMAE